MNLGGQGNLASKVTRLSQGGRERIPCCGIRTSEVQEEMYGSWKRGQQEDPGEG